MERMLDDDLVFPYPFAARTPQGVEWEDLLQTVKVRYNHDGRPTELTNYFDISVDATTTTPVFILVRQGHALDDHERLATRRRDQFTYWVWEHFKVDIQVINRHSHSVDIWWVHDDRKQYQSTLKPYHKTSFQCRLSHTFWVRDARVNQHLSSSDQDRQNTHDYPLLSENSTLQVFHIVQDEQRVTVQVAACFDLATNCEADHCIARNAPMFQYGQRYCRKTCGRCDHADDIAARHAANTCQDRDGYCKIWAQQGQCAQYEDYMRLKCPLSCHFCDPRNDNDSNNDHSNGGSNKERTKKWQEDMNEKLLDSNGDDIDQEVDEDFDFVYSSDSGDDDDEEQEEHDEL